MSFPDIISNENMKAKKYPTYIYEVAKRIENSHEQINNVF